MGWNFDHALPATISYPKLVSNLQSMIWILSEYLWIVVTMWHVHLSSRTNMKSDPIRSLSMDEWAIRVGKQQLGKSLFSHWIPTHNMVHCFDVCPSIHGSKTDLNQWMLWRCNTGYASDALELRAFDVAFYDVQCKKPGWIGLRVSDHKRNGKQIIWGHFGIEWKTNGYQPICLKFT